MYRHELLRRIETCSRDEARKIRPTVTRAQASFGKILSKRDSRVRIDYFIIIFSNAE
jgi:hypothetical protein